MCFGCGFLVHEQPHEVTCAVQHPMNHDHLPLYLVEREVIVDDEDSIPESGEFRIIGDSAEERMAW